MGLSIGGNDFKPQVQDNSLLENNKKEQKVDNKKNSNEERVAPSKEAFMAQKERALASIDSGNEQQPSETVNALSDASSALKSSFKNLLGELFGNNKPEDFSSKIKAPESVSSDKQKQTNDQNSGAILESAQNQGTQKTADQVLNENIQNLEKVPPQNNPQQQQQSQQVHTPPAAV